MSTIHALEPQAYGLIKFQTTFGDIDIELFTKQCPKITRNFVKFCLDKFYDKAKLYKLEKDFIAIVGEFKVDPGDCPRLPDEIHSRLRFTRRGLVATANTKKDANGPEFFFTLGPTQELQGKHTIFGRVRGDSLYNLVDLNDCPVDAELRPKGDKIVNLVTVIENPFPDLENNTANKVVVENQSESEKSSSDDEDSIGLALDQNRKLSFFPSEDEDDEEEDVEEQEKNLNVETKASVTRPPVVTSNSHTKLNIVAEKEEDPIIGHIPKEVSKEERLREIRAQIQFIRNQLERDNHTKQSNSQEVEAIKEEEYAISKKESKLETKDKRLREQETIEILESFKKKLKRLDANQANYSIPSENCTNDDAVDEKESPTDELAALDQVDGDDWLFHKFDANDPPPKNNSSKGEDSSQDNSYHKLETRNHSKLPK